jgi:uncharacterized membrane protein YGL010W
MDSVKTLNYSVFVKSLENQMAFYAAYHQDVRNKATHFVGVPLIMLAILVPLSWLRLDAGVLTVTGAILLAAVVLAYYFILDVPLALASAAGCCSSSATISRAADRRWSTSSSRFS